MQDICTAALVRAKQLSHCSVLLCKIASQHACATAITPMEICPSYRCALMQDICTAALVRAKQLSHCSVLLCKPASQHACATAIAPMEICPSYRRALMQDQCTAAVVKTAFPLFSAALQTSLTAALCHCNHTYGDLPFIQVCTDARHMHCSTGQGKTASPQFSAALQTSLTACPVPLQSHLWRFALDTGVH